MKTMVPSTHMIDHLISRLLETNWAAAHMLQPPAETPISHLLSLKSTHTHLPLHPNSPRNTVPTLPQPNPAHPHPDFLRPSQLITPAPTHPVTASDRLLQSMLTQPFLPGIESFIGIKILPVYISPIRTSKVQSRDMQSC